MWSQAKCLSGLGDIYRLLGQYDDADEAYTASVKFYNVINDLKGKAQSLSGLGRLYVYQDKYEDAIKNYNAALNLYVQLGELHGLDQRNEAYVLVGLADVYRIIAEYSDAESCYHSAMASFIKVEDKFGEANCLVGLAELDNTRKNDDSAQKFYAKVSTYISHWAMYMDRLIVWLDLVILIGNVESTEEQSYNIKRLWSYFALLALFMDKQTVYWE